MSEAREVSDNGPVLSGISEVVLRVDDLEAMESFYRKVLGLEPWKASEGLVFLKITEPDSPLGRSGRHPQLLALVDRDRHPWQWRGPTSGPVDPARSSLDHVAFEISPVDFPGARRRLEDLGLDVETASFPEMEARALFVRDPEGNVVELICHHAEDNSP